MIVLRSVLAVVLLLSGQVMQPATALHAAAASHAGHALDAAYADPADSAPHAHHCTDMAIGDCCETTNCDCGCAAPHAPTLPVSPPRTNWRAALPEFAFVVKSFHSNTLPAPFRPPA